jgi:hypothetical protein
MKRASESQIICNPLSDTTPESEVRTLAGVYAFILECHAKRKAAEDCGDENGDMGHRLRKEGRPPCNVED